MSFPAKILTGKNSSRQLTLQKVFYSTNFHILNIRRKEKTFKASISHVYQNFDIYQQTENTQCTFTNVVYLVHSWGFFLLTAYFSLSFSTVHSVTFSSAKSWCRLGRDLEILSRRRLSRSFSEQLRNSRLSRNLSVFVRASRTETTNRTSCVVTGKTKSASITSPKVPTGISLLKERRISFTPVSFRRLK